MLLNQNPRKFVAWHAKTTRYALGGMCDMSSLRCPESD